MGLRAWGLDEPTPLDLSVATARIDALGVLWDELDRRISAIENGLWRKRILSNSLYGKTPSVNPQQFLAMLDASSAYPKRKKKRKHG